MDFKTDFYFLWRDFQYRNMTSFKQFSKKAKILGQSMSERHSAEQNGISYLPFFILQTKKKKVRSIQTEALAPYSVAIDPKVLASKQTSLCCSSEFYRVQTYKTESCMFTQYFFGITLPKVFAVKSLSEKRNSYTFEKKSSRKAFFSESLKAELSQKEKYRRQGIQKARTDNTLSGEVFKERFTDIFQTSLEQVGFSLESNNKKSYKGCRATLWKKLQNGTNRRFPYFPPLSFSFLLSFPRTKVLQNFEKKHQKRLCSTKLVPYQEYGRQRDTKPNKIALTIKIGDYFSSGDKIGEKALCKKRVLQKNKSLFAQRPKICKQEDVFANKALFCNANVACKQRNLLTNQKFVRNVANKVELCNKNTTYKSKLWNTSVAFAPMPVAFLRTKRSFVTTLASDLMPLFNKSEICKEATGNERGKTFGVTNKANKSEICKPCLRNKPVALTKHSFVSLLTNFLTSTNRRFVRRFVLVRKGKGHQIFDLSGHGRTCSRNVDPRLRTRARKAIFAKLPQKSFVRTTITPTSRTHSAFKVKTLSQKRRKCQNISTPIILGSSGRIVTISKTQVIVQKTQPVLFYKSANLHIKKGSWVKQGAPILTLTHQTLITGDIVQGIPRIEQLFEAFTSPPPAFKDKGDFTKFKDGYNTLHSQVRDIFRNNWLKNRLPIAVRKSLEEIGYILVEMIQKVYLSQGVLIADKHIEIIVRQIASKGQILDSGTTGLFLEEVLPIRQIENANLTTPGKKSLYVPAVMGLTAAALNSDSFISAASFQETTRVLSRDAVVGKSDFLRGLKEKVVIGDLISAGTGLDLYFIYTTMLTS